MSRPDRYGFVGWPSLGSMDADEPGDRSYGPVSADRAAGITAPVGSHNKEVSAR